MSSVNAIVAELKNKNEDFEFYPTTDDIILALTKDLKELDESYPNYKFSFDSFLDIGTGTGKVINFIKKVFDGEYKYVKCYAIENKPKQFTFDLDD